MEKISIPIDQKLALRIEEAAELIGCKRSHTYFLIKSGRLKARKSGSRTLILRADLEAYLASTPERKTPTGAA